MSMEDAIQDALDDLASNKSSTARQGRALDKLERLLAEICVTADASSTDALQYFVSLQDTFQCNVPFRLLGWISNSLFQLSLLTSKTATTKDHDLELTTLSSQIAQALSIMQGIALIHSGSKRYLGRKHPLEVLVELFYSSRRVPPIPTSVSTNLSVPSPTISDSRLSRDKSATSIPLANIVLDTLLCILVDAPSALRVFESVNGVHTLVKMFKRAATPREVRMRCIEFLYFYLMDESPLGRPDQDYQYQRSHSSSVSSTNSDQQAPTAPSSPIHSNPHNRRSALSVSQLSDSSVSSIDSCTTAASDSTRATSVASSRRSSVSSSVPPPVAPPLAPSPNIVEKPRYSRPNSALSIIKAEGDTKPLTPRHAQARLGVGTPRMPAMRDKLRRKDNAVFSSDDATEPEDGGNSTNSLAARLEDLDTPRQIVQRTQAMSLGQLGTPATPSNLRGHRRAQSTIEVGSPPMARSPGGGKEGGSKVIPSAGSGVRSMQEKKAFLATMLGNVDALVESIQKAGVLGLV